MKHVYKNEKSHDFLLNLTKFCNKNDGQFKTFKFSRQNSKFSALIECRYETVEWKIVPLKIFAIRSNLAQIFRCSLLINGNQ